MCEAVLRRFKVKIFEQRVNQEPVFAEGIEEFCNFEIEEDAAGVDAAAVNEWIYELIICLKWNLKVNERRADMHWGGD